MQIYKIVPVPKPRMTRQDKWKNPPPKYRGKEWPRRCVKNWRTFQNMVIANKVTFPEDGAHIIFFIAMPPSWSQKKKDRMFGQLHKQTPDLDNLAKALCDAVYGKKDQVIADIRYTKRWAHEDAIQIFEEMCFF